MDNCGVDDYELSLLLEGLNRMKGFERLVYKNNVFLEDSLEAIKPILMHQSPRNLLQMRLINL